MSREPLSLRWHRATYPRHLVYRRRGLVTAQRRFERMFSQIEWAD